MGWTLKKEGDISFETASSNWKDEGICDVYFCETGTLMFISMDMCAESWSLKNANTLTFALSETSMAFNLNYCENGILKRSIMEIDDRRMFDGDEKLEVEDRSEDTSEVIWNQMEVVLGKSFRSIGADETAERYLFVKETKSEDSNAKEESVSEQKPMVRRDEKQQKKWWKFWL